MLMVFVITCIIMARMVMKMNIMKMLMVATIMILMVVTIMMMMKHNKGKDKHTLIYVTIVL